MKMNKSINGVITPLSQQEQDALAAQKAEANAGLAQINRDDAIAKRQSRYRVESDPMYLEAQYTGEATDLQAWRDKVAQIKSEIPLPAV